MPPPRKNLVNRAFRSFSNYIGGNCNTQKDETNRCKVTFTLAGVFSVPSVNKHNFAFTLAEVLITLGIIGVVAAITMPTLIQNYKNEVAVQKLKKAYSTWSQAFQNMLTDEGVEKLSNTQLWYNADFGSCPSSFDCPGTFPLDLMKKYVKMEFERNGSGYYITMPDGVFIYLSLSRGTTTSAATCKRIKELGGSMCSQVGRFQIRTNGKESRKSGRDVFSFMISDEGKLYPNGGKDYALFNSQTDLSTNQYYWKTGTRFSACDFNLSLEYRSGCTARIMENGWKMDY